MAVRPVVAAAFLFFLYAGPALAQEDAAGTEPAPEATSRGLPLPWTPLQIGVAPGWQLFRTETPVRGVRLGMVMDRTEEVAGLSLALAESRSEKSRAGIEAAFSTAGGPMSGISLGALNRARSEESSSSGLKGMQLGLGFNVVQGDAVGLQISPGGNVASGGALSGVQVGGLVSAAEEVRGAQFAGLVAAAETVHGPQLAGLVSAGDTVFGLQLAGLVSAADNVRGPQLAGFVAAADSVKGPQIAGLVSAADSVSVLQFGGLVAAAGEVSGGQVAILGNVSGEIRGVQLGLGANLAQQVNGFQIGSLVAGAEEIEGAQISLLANGYRVQGSGPAFSGPDLVSGVQLSAAYNEAVRVSGLQIALVNKAREVRGAQIGLVNIRNGRLGFPLINPASDRRADTEE